MNVEKARTVGAEEQDLGLVVQINQAFLDTRALAGDQQVNNALQTIHS